LALAKLSAADNILAFKQIAGVINTNTVIDVVRFSHLVGAYDFAGDIEIVFQPGLDKAFRAWLGFRRGCCWLFRLDFFKADKFFRSGKVSRGDEGGFAGKRRGYRIGQGDGFSQEVFKLIDGGKGGRLVKKGLPDLVG